MPTINPVIEITEKQIFVLARLSDEDLLQRAKADLLTSLASDVLTTRNLPEALGGLSKLIDTIRVFRERTARAAGSKLAPVVAGLFNDGGEDFCKKTNYCKRRKTLRESLDKVRNAITIAEVVKELAEIGELLASIAELLANLKLPLSVIFLILLYALDEVCKCPAEVAEEKGRKKPVN